MWTKIKNRNWSKSARTRFGISKTNRGFCYLLLPASAGFDVEDFVEYFSADGKIGFQRAKSGYAVFHNGNTGKTRRASMPSATSDFFPAGTTDIEVTRDGEMYVIDLAQFDVREAAE